MNSQLNPYMTDTEQFCYSLFHGTSDHKFNQSLWCSDYLFFFNMWEITETTISQPGVLQEWKLVNVFMAGFLASLCGCKVSIKSRISPYLFILQLVSSTRLWDLSLNYCVFTVPGIWYIIGIQGRDLIWWASRKACSWGVGSCWCRDKETAMWAIWGGGSKEEMGLFHRGSVYPRGRLAGHRFTLAGLQQQQVWVQCTEEDMEQWKKELECFLQESWMDSGTWWIPRHLQEVPSWVHVGCGGPHTWGPPPSHKCTAGYTAAGKAIDSSSICWYWPAAEIANRSRSAFRSLWKTPLRRVS